MPDAPKTLTYAKLSDIRDGLSGLDGLRTKPDEFRPYRFDDDGEVTWAIASNIAVIETQLKVFDVAKKSLAVQHGLSDRVQVTKENIEQVNAFMNALSAVEAKEVPVPGLQLISRASLKVGVGEKKNPIPATVLAKLMPVLSE